MKSPLVVLKYPGVGSQNFSGGFNFTKEVPFMKFRKTKKTAEKSEEGRGGGGASILQKKSLSQKSEGCSILQKKSL